MKQGVESLQFNKKKSVSHRERQLVSNDGQIPGVQLGF